MVSAMAQVQLQVIGGGRMGAALVAGLVQAGWAEPASLRIVEAVPARRLELADQFPGLDIADAPSAAAGSVVAVKPGDVDEAVRAIAPLSPRILSIAAGVPLARLEAAAGPQARVVRAMPNTPALIGAGAAAIAAGTRADADDLAWAESLLSAVGTVVIVPEKLLDAVTGLSGSGPAYVFLMAEALIDAGVLAGLPRDTAATLAIQTLVGSARLLAEGSDGPEALRAAVTSPGGTTAAGLRVLEQQGVRAALMDAVMAARDRSAELAT
jgi:pyrroline-5-carboxylate reductase